MSWAEIFASPAAVTFYCSLALFLFRWFKQREQWDTERWEGLVANAFLLAEKSGAIGNNGKLQAALVAFNREYEKTYGKPASALDVKDAALDLAKLALQHKLSVGQ